MSKAGLNTRTDIRKYTLMPKQETLPQMRAPFTLRGYKNVCLLKKKYFFRKIRHKFINRHYSTNIPTKWKFKWDKKKKKNTVI